MNKRGQGLSITTIIVAAIALIVLVVLIAIFTGRLGFFSKVLSEKEQNRCFEDLGGTCDTVACDSVTEVRAFGANCPTKGDTCCIPSGK